MFLFPNMSIHTQETSHLNYYLSGAVCPSVCLSECLSAKKIFSSKMDQIREFGEQTSRILEFKPEGLEGYVYICLLFNK